MLKVVHRPSTPLKFSDLKPGELFISALSVGSTEDLCPWLKVSSGEAIYLWDSLGLVRSAEPYRQDREVIRVEGELTWRIP